MSLSRLAILIVGPLVLVGVAHTIAQPRWELIAPDVLPPTDLPLDDGNQSAHGDRFTQLAEECARTAEQLRVRLDPHCQIIVRVPFVIAGDMSVEMLETYHHDVIEPVSRALKTSFFDRNPDCPVAIVLLSDERGYRRQSQRLTANDGAGYYGFYQRDEHLVVVNRGTGDGTLAHELTHALSHFDFPAMPEWFDEGLAALHEESDFSEDGLRILGLHNWRLGMLREAQAREQFPTLAALFLNDSIRGEGEGLNYALARYFCLYLQEREVLIPFYRKLRGAAGQTLQGPEILCELLGQTALADIDSDFQSWLRTIP